MSSPTVSIILPVLDEAAGIVAVLEGVQDCRARGGEIIVVDGGSRDGTAALAEPLADCVTTSGRGRGRQMNAGAARAGGDILLFLHADTLLPPTALASIAASIATGARWGRFDVRIDGNIAGLGMVAALINWRSRLTGIATGDQAIFVTRAAFAQVGGFAEIALMEDIVLCTALRRLTRPACLRDKVVTAGRRWEQHGLWPTIFKMWSLRLRFWLGASPARLARDYGYAVDD